MKKIFSLLLALLPYCLLGSETGSKPHQEPSTRSNKEITEQVLKDLEIIAIEKNIPKGPQREAYKEKIFKETVAVVEKKVKTDLPD